MCDTTDSTGTSIARITEMASATVLQTGKLNFYNYQVAPTLSPRNVGVVSLSEALDNVDKIANSATCRQPLISVQYGQWRATLFNVSTRMFSRLHCARAGSPLPGRRCDLRYGVESSTGPEIHIYVYPAHHRDGEQAKQAPTGAAIRAFFLPGLRIPRLSGLQYTSSAIW